MFACDVFFQIKQKKETKLRPKYQQIAGLPSKPSEYNSLRKHLPVSFQTKLHKEMKFKFKYQQNTGFTSKPSKYNRLRQCLPVFFLLKKLSAGKFT